MVQVCWLAGIKTGTSEACRRDFRPGAAVRTDPRLAARPGATAVRGAPRGVADDEPAVVRVAEAEQRPVRRVGRNPDPDAGALPGPPAVGRPGQGQDGQRRIRVVEVQANPV